MGPSPCQLESVSGLLTSDTHEFAKQALPFLVPPLSEQRAIVRYLDHVDRRIRRYIDAKQKLIGLLEEEKQAIINQAVTRGLDPNVRLKPSGVEWLGDVPVHWEVRHESRLRSASPHRLRIIKTAPAVKCEFVSGGAYLRSTGRLPRDCYGSITGTSIRLMHYLLEWTRLGLAPEPWCMSSSLARHQPGEACHRCPATSASGLTISAHVLKPKVDRNAYEPQFLVHMLYAWSTARRD